MATKIDGKYYNTYEVTLQVNVNIALCIYKMYTSSHHDRVLSIDSHFELVIDDGSSDTAKIAAILNFGRHFKINKFQISNT
jgi:hypothetical protein